MAKQFLVNVIKSTVKIKTTTTNNLVYGLYNEMTIFCCSFR